MKSLYKVAYVIGAATVIVALWHSILPNDMITILKVRYSAYVLLFFVILYFVLKNIIFAKKDK